MAASSALRRGRAGEPGVGSRLFLKRGARFELHPRMPFRADSLKRGQPKKLCEITKSSRAAACSHDSVERDDKSDGFEILPQKRSPRYLGPNDVGGTAS